MDGDIECFCQPKIRQGRAEVLSIANHEDRQAVGDILNQICSTLICVGK